MNKEFAPYPESLALKALGFDEPCFATYEFGKLFIGEFRNTLSLELCEITETFPAPTFSQAFRWFREKYKINSQIAFCEYSIERENSWKFTFDNPTKPQYWQGKFNSYEEAEISCLRKLIEITKTK